jgi:hypothetical protein
MDAVFLLLEVMAIYLLGAGQRPKITRLRDFRILDIYYLLPPSIVVVGGGG